MASSFKIGTTSGGITSLDALTTPLPDPQHEFREYRKMVTLGDGTLFGVGPQTVIWSFPMLDVDQIAQLEFFQASDPIYIQTLKRDDTEAVFEVLCKWLDPRQDGSHRPGFRGWRMGLELEFVILSEVV